MKHYYDTQENRLNTVVHSGPGSMSRELIGIWMCIKRAREDFNKGDHHGCYAEPTTERFRIWLKETWGIVITNAQDGYNLAPEFDIIAEDKYTMFMLKYSV